MKLERFYTYAMIGDSVVGFFGAYTVTVTLKHDFEASPDDHLRCAQATEHYGFVAMLEAEVSVAISEHSIRIPDARAKQHAIAVNVGVTSNHLDAQAAVLAHRALEKARNMVGSAALAA